MDQRTGHPQQTEMQQGQETGHAKQHKQEGRPYRREKITGDAIPHCR
jgi:hypothetical protein